MVLDGIDPDPERKQKAQTQVEAVALREDETWQGVTTRYLEAGVMSDNTFNNALRRLTVGGDSR